jgi:phosphocarrier protein HPr
MQSITLEIINKKGLHARAAAKFVKAVAGCSARVNVKKLGEEDAPVVSGGSILGLMMLGADPGSKLLITADGAQAVDAIAALKNLVENRFGEPE